MNSGPMQAVYRQKLPPKLSAIEGLSKLNNTSCKKRQLRGNRMMNGFGKNVGRNLIDAWSGK
jgi:hypothetical protein